MAAQSGRFLIAALLAAPLAACGDTPAAQAIRTLAPPAPPAARQTMTPTGPALVLTTPRRATLTPVSETGDHRIWRGAGNIALGTEGARVVSTAGFARMVMATRFDGPDPLDDPRALVGHQAHARRTVDLADASRDPRSMRFGLALDCILQGGMDQGWILVEERCRGGGQAFTNRFWADPVAGHVRRSEQWAGEGIGPLTIRREGP